MATETSLLLWREIRASIHPYGNKERSCSGHNNLQWPQPDIDRKKRPLYDEPIINEGTVRKHLSLSTDGPE